MKRKVYRKNYDRLIAYAIELRGLQYTDMKSSIAVLSKEMGISTKNRMSAFVTLDIAQRLTQTDCVPPINYLPPWRRHKSINKMCWWLRQRMEINRQRQQCL